MQLAHRPLWSALQGLGSEAAGGESGTKYQETCGICSAHMSCVMRRLHAAAAFFSFCFHLCIKRT